MKLFFVATMTLVAGLKFEKHRPFQPYSAPVAVELEGVNGSIFFDTFSLLNETKLLRISGSYLTEIEDSALCSSVIVEINIFDNLLLPEISKRNFDCPNLKILKIINNRNFDFENDSFSLLGGLENFTISGQKIESINREFLGGLKQIRGLHLNFCGVKTITNDAFSDLVELRELRLVHNNLREFQVFLGSSINLQILDLTSNRLETFSWITLQDLNDLKFVGLGRNKINKFQVKEMARFLKQVEILEIDFNPVACQERKEIVAELKDQIVSLQVFFNVFSNNSCFEEF